MRCRARRRQTRLQQEADYCRRSALPDVAPVCHPSRITWTPLTISCSTSSAHPVRLLAFREIDDRRVVEDIGEHSFAQQAAVAGAESRRDGAGHSADRVLEREELLLAHVSVARHRDMSATAPDDEGCMSSEQRFSIGAKIGRSPQIGD